jgi:hypothetical protein
VANAFKLGCNPFVTPYDIVQVRSRTYIPQFTRIDCSHRTRPHTHTHTHTLKTRTRRTLQGNRKLNLAFTATLFHKYAECAEKRRHDEAVIQARVRPHSHSP